MSVSWSAPRSPDGGEEPLAHYLLQFLAVPGVQPTLEVNSIDMETVLEGAGHGAGDWQNVTVPGNALSARLVRLAPATRHRVRVLAVNDLGPGPASEEVVAITLQEGESGYSLSRLMSFPPTLHIAFTPQPPAARPLN